MKTSSLALALLFAAPGALAQEFKEAVQGLQAAEKARDPEQFASAASKVLKDDSARAVREVLDAYGRFCAEKPALDAVAHYRLHSDLAQELGRIGSAPGREEVIRQRENDRDWQVRLLCLDAASFKPEPLQLREGAIEALRDKSPAVTRRALEYLKNDKRLATVEAVVGRYLEIDGPKGPKGDDWTRLRYAFRSALVALIKVPLPAAVDYKGYVASRREKPELLFDHPPPERGPTGITIFGAEVTGNNITFVIDVSGSMLSTDPIPIKPDPGKTVVAEKMRAKEAEMFEDRRRINRAKKELTKVVQALPDGKRFNIIAYSSEVVPWKKILQPVNAATRKEAVEFIASLKAEGITVTDDAMENAFSDLAVDTIYLITDGAPTHVGNRGAEIPPDAPEIIAAIHKRVKEVNYFRGVRVFALGFPEAEENFLKKLAADNAGEYTPIR